MWVEKCGGWWEGFHGSSFHMTELVIAYLLNQLCVLASADGCRKKIHFFLAFFEEQMYPQLTI